MRFTLLKRTSLAFLICLVLCVGPNPVTAGLAPSQACTTCTAQTTAYASETISCNEPDYGEDHPSNDCYSVLFATASGDAHVDVEFADDTLSVHVVGFITTDKYGFTNHVDEVWGDLGNDYSFLMDPTGLYINGPNGTDTFSATVINDSSYSQLEGSGTVSASGFNYQASTAVIHLSGSACYHPRGGCLGIGDGGGGYGTGQQAWGGTYEACP